MEKPNLKLSAPWETYARELIALFGQDPDIDIRQGELEEGVMNISIFVRNSDKAAALSKLIPEEKKFGNITVNTQVVPPNENEEDVDTVLRRAFSGNPVVESIMSPKTPFGQLSYVLFKKEVVQFYNDQMDDLNGNKSTLYQDIAREILNAPTGVYFCTNDRENGW